MVDKKDIVGACSAELQAKADKDVLYVVVDLCGLTPDKLAQRHIARAMALRAVKFGMPADKADGFEQMLYTTCNPQQVSQRINGKKAGGAKAERAKCDAKALVAGMVD